MRSFRPPPCALLATAMCAGMRAWCSAMGEDRGREDPVSRRASHSAGSVSKILVNKNHNSVILSQYVQVQQPGCAPDRTMHRTRRGLEIQYYEIMVSCWRSINETQFAMHPERCRHRLQNVSCCCFIRKAISHMKPHHSVWHTAPAVTHSSVPRISPTKLFLPWSAMHRWMYVILNANSSHDIEKGLLLHSLIGSCVIIFSCATERLLGSRVIIVSCETI